MRSLAPVAALALLFTVAGCGSKPAEGDAAPKKDEPEPEAEPEPTPAEEPPAEEPPAEDAKDDTLGIVAVARVAMGQEAKPLPKADESSPKHFHTENDKGGAIAHEATALAHTDAVHSDKLHQEMIKLAHETDEGPTDEKICLHVYEEVLLKVLSDDEQDEIEDEEAAKKKFLVDCPHELERERAKLGPEVFAEMATCVMEATDMPGLEFCDMAEAEAEEKLHAAPHGDGLDRKTCEAFHDHFAELALADMPEDDEEGKKLLEEILADVKEDSVLSCMDHGSKAEVECAMKAKDTVALEACEWGDAPEG